MRWPRLVLLLVLLPVAVHAQEQPAPLRVFYTGHSFHMFVPTRVAQMVKAAGIKEYQQVGQQGLGGSRVKQHWDLPVERNSARKILEKGGTDIFTMAPNVTMPDEGIDQFAALGLEHSPKLRLLIQESWVPGDYLGKRIRDNALRDETDMSRLRADQEKWRSQMEAQARVINEKAGRQAVCIVPVGAAVVKLRAMVLAGKVPGISKQSELFRDPIGHGNAPILILTAYCNFACITGRSPVGLDVSEKGVSKDLNTLLQQLAWDTVTSYPMSGVKGPG